MTCADCPHNVEVCSCGHATEHHDLYDPDQGEVPADCDGCLVYVVCADPDNHCRLHVHSAECRKCPCPGAWRRYSGLSWDAPSS